MLAHFVQPSVLNILHKTPIYIQACGGAGDKALHQLVPAKISVLTCIHTPSTLFFSHLDPLRVSWGQDTNWHLYTFGYNISYFWNALSNPFLIWKATNYFSRPIVTFLYYILHIPLLYPLLYPSCPQMKLTTANFVLECALYIHHVPKDTCYSCLFTC